MFRYLIVVLCCVFGVLISMYLFIGVPTIFTGSEGVVSNIHRSGDTTQPISNVHITAFYFVPKNKANVLFSDWHRILQENLETLVNFHKIQLQGLSTLTFDIYPEPIIGLAENLTYDTEMTQYGNPEALRRILPEIESRVSMTSVPQNTYHVYYILYEGVGATGGENAALISRTFLSDEEYKVESSSLFAHEFYHTLGLPDEYTIPEGREMSDDIMSIGRYRPISQTYISLKLLQSLGL